MKGNVEAKFSEADYLSRHPDIREAKNSNQNFDLKYHFDNFGVLEGRHLDRDIKIQIEQCLITNSGYVFLSGWLLDSFRRKSQHESPQFSFKLKIGFYEFEIPQSSIVRYFRSDVNQTFNVQGNYDFGFVILYKIEDNILISNILQLIIKVDTANLAIAETKVNICSEPKLIGNYFTIFRHLLGTNNGFGACLNAYDVQGKEIISCWQEHVKNSKAHQVIRLGSNLYEPKFSFITVLYGTTELLQQQFHLLFADAAKLHGEIILVSNSIEIHNEVVRLSHYAQKLYNINLTLILNTDNVGFSQANNTGFSYAKSDNIVLVNPDIFPFKLTNWRRFTHVLNDLNNNQIIGPFMHYSDGSVMHSGMSFHKDEIVFVPRNDFEKKLLSKKQYEYVIRIDHPQKGHLMTSFADENVSTNHLIPVEAVSGGFMLIKRKLFEMIGGFSTKYVFGHFEDADLCLKAKSKGAEILCDPNLNFVHLEGKGSKSLNELASSGSKIFNQCHFTRNHKELF